MMAMARDAFSHHGPLENMPGSEQGRGAVALIVVRHRSAAAFLEPADPFAALSGNSWVKHSDEITEAGKTTRPAAVKP